MKRFKVLTADQHDQFLNDGYIVLRGTIPREVAAPIISRVWKLAGIDPDKPESWTRPFVHLQDIMVGPEVDAAYTPYVVNIFDDLLGEGRYKLKRNLGWWPITFPGFQAPPWKPPTGGWHVDGSWFHHHVYSREQGLLTLHLYSDIAPGGGGTAIIPGSHRFVSRMLARFEPEGLANPQETHTGFYDYVNDHLHRAIELTGNVGDVAVLHPFMMHSQSVNTGKVPRIVCNPCQSLNEHMNFHRDNPEDYSPVERAIVDSAGDLLVNVHAPGVAAPAGR